MSNPQNPWQQGVPSGFPVWDDAGLAAVTGLVVGAAIIADPTEPDFRKVTLPAAAAGDVNVTGVVTDDYGSTGPAVGKPVNFRKMGRGKVLIKASTAVTRNDLLITSGDGDGTLIPRGATTGTMVIVARARETLSSVAAIQECAADIICQLAKF